MATDAPITGAPTRAPDSDARPVSLLACDAQTEIYRIRTLAIAASRLTEGHCREGDPTGETIGHICNLVDVIAETATRALGICEKIEVES